jgi:predicted metal-dependent peptidase
MSIDSQENTVETPSVSEEESTIVEDVEVTFDAADEATREEMLKKAAEINRRMEEAMMANPREFEHDFLSVFMHEPFLGGVSLEITKRPDGRIETAAVGVDPTTTDLFMIYNPEFFRKLTPIERRGVIRHELYHVIFNHLIERMPADKQLAVAWNVATDMAINSIIGADNLPDLAIIPGKHIKPRKDQSDLDKKFGEFVKNAPLLQASEFYFEQIKKLMEEDKKNGGDGTITVDGIDEHDLWGKLPQNIRDMIKEKIHGMVEKAAKKADAKNQWGSVPLEIQERIRKMISKEIDWRSVVRNFFGRCRSQERVSTLKRVNKKMPYIYPGTKRNTVANFACFVDQSGSVGDEDIVLFFGELESFAEHTELDVYHFDTEIDVKSHTRWRKGVKITPRRTRHGGTDFDAVRRFCNDKGNRGRWSGIVILTDGYAPKMGQIIGARVLWVITTTGDASAARPGDFVIQMKKDKQMRSAFLVQNDSSLKEIDKQEIFNNDDLS